jgi:hypothetical protein
MYKYKKLRIGDKLIDEHRYKMEQKLGRKLRYNEIVHHRNGKYKDNHMSNLKVESRITHPKEHFSSRFYSKIGKKSARMAKYGQKRKLQRT